MLNSLSQSHIENLVTQVDARKILQEVKETTENYPNFDPLLTEKTTHIAYAFLSCGCSLIEKTNSDSSEGIYLLERAGKILSDAYKYNAHEPENKNNNLLVAGMALYAAKQYSRAFIVLSGIDACFPVGKMVAKFIRMDFKSLLYYANSTFFSDPPKLSGVKDLSEWIISHEIARCFFIITDFVRTGNQEDFALTDGIFDKLLIIATENSLTFYWLIIRLLRIIFATFQRTSLWSVLPPILTNQSNTGAYIQLLSSFNPPITQMWPSQTASLPLAVGENTGAVINLRTSGGKTRVAEVAILNTLSNHTMSKVLYLAPFRSLAFEIEQTLAKTFGPLGITVSQLYGGSTANVTDFELIEQSRVIIATPEKAKALTRCAADLKTEVKLIVVDEGHLLGAEERHIKNEIFLTHIKEFAARNEIRILLLSAVLPNAYDLAQWVADDSTAVARSDWKPALERLGLLLWDGSRVKLEWKSEGNPFNPSFIQQKRLVIGTKQKLFPNSKNEAIAAAALRLSKNGTVMIYSARANSVEGLAKSVLLAMGEHPVDFTWNKSLWNVFESLCKEELPDDNIILTAAKKGIICHSNRLPTLVRIAIEKLMRSKQPLIIIATSTLGQGVNVGISTVIVSTPYYSKEVISKRDFWNICGRAGRAFSDIEGKVLYAIDTQAKTNKDHWRVKKDKELAQDYFNNQQMEIVQSGLLAALKEIYRIGMQTDTDFSLLVEAIANDTVATTVNVEYAKKLNDFFDLIDDVLLAMNSDFGDGDDANIEWVDDVFRRSLVLIQAEAEHADEYLDLLKARTISLLNQIPDPVVRNKLIASGVPLSVSKAIMDDVEYFRNLALSLELATDEFHKLKQIISIVRALEIWSNKNASNIMDFVPEQEKLDSIRSSWINGIALSEIIKLEQSSTKISKDYYGFTLPWIIHAISQMFDVNTEQNIFEIYSTIAMFVELGLPNLTSVNIYMSGVRSRSVAVELSALDIFDDSSIADIKRVFASSILTDIDISDNSKAWLEFLSDLARAQTPKKVSFPTFIWKRDGLPQKLYLREINEECYLMSSDGYFFEKVESSDELPFANIANISELYFERENNIWHLKSYNPLLIVD